MRNNNTTTRTNRRKKIFKANKSFVGKGKNCYTIAIRQYKKACVKRYISAKLIKRDMRKKWISNINNYLRFLSYEKKILMNYSTFIRVIIENGLSRKIVSDMIDEGTDITHLIKQAYINF